MTFKTLRPPSKSNKHVQEYVRAVEKGLDSYFVVQNGEGWYVRRAASQSNKGKLLKTKTDALRYANQEAKKTDGEILVFSNKGALLSRNTPRE